MTEAEWLTGEDISRLVDHVDGRDERKALLLACAICRTVWDYLTDDRGRTALLNLEIYADDPSKGELRQIANNLTDERFRVTPESEALNAVHLASIPTLRKHVWDSVSYVLSSVAGHDRPARRQLLRAVIHDSFGNPFRPVAFSPRWRTDTAVALARQMYDARDFSAMPILADALQDAGCESADILDHCRGPGPHARGCWVCDLVLDRVESAMTEAEWLGCVKPAPMLNLVRAGSARKSRLFACACCRRIRDLITIPCSRTAVEVAERFADGSAAEEERLAAFTAAIREANGWTNCCEGTAFAFAGGVFAAAFAVAAEGTVENTGAAVVIAETRSPDLMHTPTLIASFDSSDGAGAAAGAWVQAHQAGNVEDEYRTEWESAVLAAGAVRAAAVGVSAVTDGTDCSEVQRRVQAVEKKAQCDLLRDIYGNPFRPVEFYPEWETDTVLALARQMYESRDFSTMPLLANALQDAGCEDEQILSHCRGEWPHVRGCWVVDSVLGKE